MSSAVPLVALATYATRLLCHAHISHIFLRCLSKLIFVIFSLLLLRFAFSPFVHRLLLGSVCMCVCVCVQLTFAYRSANAGSKFLFKNRAKQSVSIHFFQDLEEDSSIAAQRRLKVYFFTRRKGENSTASETLNRNIATKPQNFYTKKLQFFLIEKE